MAIPENQLDTWSKQGSVTQSQATYATVRGVLNDSNAPYAAKSFNIFLQGSYGNDTNIYADSDVDVVICLDSTFYFDLDNLDDTEKAKFNSDLSPATYSYEEFKSAVITQLKSKFGSSVKPGKKAIFVQGDGNRRDADVLAAAQYRRYDAYRSSSDYRRADGIVFWTTDGQKIINYPKQHSANCTTKHQATSSWFKPMVRILKNMRNRMVGDGYLAEGVAPSYFLEGMLYNAPNGCFGNSYGDTFVSAINWLLKSDRSKLLCANEQYLLLHATSPVTWREEKFEAYLAATIKYWNEW